MESTCFAPLILSAALAVPCSLHASGGWYDVEPPHSLAGDLDRLPAKSLGTIILELRAKAEPAAAEEANARLPVGFLDRIGKEKPAVLAAEIDRLVARARRNYQENKDWLPVLYDVRDAITAPGVKDESRKAYGEGRVGAELKLVDGADPAGHAKDDPMRPHLLYQQGAALFAGGDRVECVPWFREIVQDHVTHPRAEGAYFLLARCALSASRADDLLDADRAKARAAAAAAFQDYLKRYPSGRYVADAHGWMGALLWEDQPAEALKHYLAQIQDKAHPECVESAAHMIERVLGRVVAKPEGSNRAVFRVVAQDPQVAQAAVYFVLNAPEIDPYDGKFDEPAALRRWRLRVLPMLASAVAEEKARYTGSWSLRMRAMLAQAASAEGKQDDALKLVGTSEEEWKSSDDLLFARLVVLQRARRAADAVLAGRLFLETFPESPLREGARIRLAQSLVDSQHAGEAFLVLGQIEQTSVDRWHGNSGDVYPPAEDELELVQPAVYPDVQGHDAFETLRETIVQFAPLPELEAVLKDPYWDKDAEALATFKESIALRKAAREDFAGAAAMVKEGTDRPKAVQMLKAFENLGKLLSVTEQAVGPEAKAAAMVALGDALAVQAVDPSPLATESALADGLVRRENARALGYRNPDKELEDLHPMRHATKWWLAAARAVPGTPLSAQARLKVLRGIEKIAVTNDYDFTRARETKADEVSRQIYDVLVKESPGSPEARAAAWLDFPPCPVEPAEPGALVAPVSPRGESDPYREVEMVRLLGGYKALPYDAFGEFPPCLAGDDDTNIVLEPIRERMQTASTHLDSWENVLTVGQVEAWWKIARPAVENAEQVKVVNLLEDLGFFLKVEGLTQPARTAYIQLRLRAEDFPGWIPSYSDSGPSKDPRPSVKELLAKARDSASLQPLADFLDYAELYANEADRGPEPYFDPVYPTYASVEKGCRAFLEKHPRSVRREACYVLLMRAIFRQLPERWLHAPPPPGADEGDEGPLVESEEPFRPAKLLKAIADYEKEFAQPRYPAEVRNFRGLIAWRTADFGTALDLTMAQLDDKEHLDLRREGAVRLANIFADLRDPLHCRAALEAIKARPMARKHLEAWMALAPKFADHPLRCRTRFTREALGK